MQTSGFTNESYIDLCVCFPDLRHVIKASVIERRMDILTNSLEVKPETTTDIALPLLSVEDASSGLSSFTLSFPALYPALSVAEPLQNSATSNSGNFNVDIAAGPGALFSGEGSGSSKRLIPDSKQEVPSERNGRSIIYMTMKLELQLCSPVKLS